MIFISLRATVRGLVLRLIELYQRTLSPDHGFGRSLLPQAGCRFFPSCSTYAHEAITKYGLVRGGILSMSRVSRCHPWQPGGYDPIP